MSRIVSVVMASFVLMTSAPALGGGKKRQSPGKVRDPHLSGETLVRGSQTNVDFGEAQINGAPKTPGLSVVDGAKSREGYDFVKLRLRWHPEMVQSASSLDSVE